MVPVEISRLFVSAVFDGESGEVDAGYVYFDVGDAFAVHKFGKDVSLFPADMVFPALLRARRIIA